ncbi:GAF domain-containing protein [Sphingomonas floccifaciens]|uniref:GAF domain-containing protein n=1 Tax=Sphingomonas floccifaciens TaxID=1844115 RepID=A0ABW4NGN5_9SPHN
MKNPFRRPAKSKAGKSPPNDNPQLATALDAIAAAATADDALAALVSTARAAIGCDGVTLVRRDADSVEYLTEDAISPLWRGQRFPIRICLSGQALLARSTIVIPDIALDKRVPLNAYLATFVRSMAVVPIGHDDPQLALGAYWKAVQPIEPLTIERMIRLADATAAIIDRDEGDGDGRRVA